MFPLRKRRRKRRKRDEIYPDEIFLDSSNLPDYNVSQFEGRIEKPIGWKATFWFLTVFLLAVVIITGKIWTIQINKGEIYQNQSEQNYLKNTPILSKRGLIYDRLGVKMVWNEIEENKIVRLYENAMGSAHILGYTSAPAKDKDGIYYRDNFEGKGGVEQFYNKYLSGENGLRIIELDALGKIESENTIRIPKNGGEITLSIDQRLQKLMHQEIMKLAQEVGFKGGAGVIMDVKTGEILVITSFPEYDPEVMSKGEDGDKIDGYLNDTKKPFLNRAVSGLYAPGSVIKPFVAAGVLNEKIITPEKQILSTGSISLPNPFFPDKVNIFKDWKAHGWIDLKNALAVSSNVYFYVVGGGFEDQKGLGIEKLEKYVRMFGFGENTGIDLPGEESGTVPSPEWKEENFTDGTWRIGDTYHTAIGQYGFQVTPLQIARAIAIIANDGKFITPTIIKNNKVKTIKNISVQKEYLKIIREGMRLGTLEGTGKALNIPQVKVATKTGTAELGVAKKNVNSWVTGFFPYENPRYSFAVVMENGPVTNLIGSSFVFKQILEWMVINTPEYLENI